MADAPVLLAIEGDVARLTLNRPHEANAIDVALARSLRDATSDLAGTEGLRVVLLTGAGDRFCGGGDVRAFAAAAPDDLAATLDEILSYLHPAIVDLAELSAPVVAAVQGSAAGAGLALVAGADLVVAAESTKFVMAYTALGLSPDGGSSWYLPRAVGLRRALDLTLTNRVLTADEALAWGLVSRVVPDVDLMSEAESIVQTLAHGPTRAYAAAKRLLRASLTATLESALSHESTEIFVAGETADAAEGVRAFVEKRRPEFSGE